MNNIIIILTYIITLKKSNSIIYNESVEFIDKTKLNFTSEKCSDNPFLSLLPKKLRRTLEITLSKNPKKITQAFATIKIQEKHAVQNLQKKMYIHIQQIIYLPLVKIFMIRIYFIIKNYLWNIKEIQLKDLN